MLEERFRVMFLSRGGLDVRQLSLTKKQFYFFAIFFTLILFGTTSFIIGAFTHYFHNTRIATLENDREHLQRELLTIKESVSSLTNQLSQLEMTGDELRNAASLPPIDKDIRQVGIGGRTYNASIDFQYSDEVGRTAEEIKSDLDKLERAVRLERSNQVDIDRTLKDQKNRVKCFPSIRPILGGRITEPYGFRIDPFIGKIAPHKGVDIPMPIGTKVLATADGVVKVAKYLYSAHKSYGMEVVIDHDYGFETRYAHLSKILVHPGQHIKRWEPIGEVGETGKATGPHLHYEVMEYSKAQNPDNFIYN